MLGAIAGDIIGSVYEGRPLKSKDFPLFSARSRFTDDTVLSVAVAKSLLSGRAYEETVRDLGRAYPGAGYGASFRNWLFADEPKPYKSWGNGSAMRVSPVGFACSSRESVLQEAEKSAAITHNHPEGIKGAQATALAVFLARQGADKDLLKREIEQGFGYELSRSVEEIRPEYGFDVSCQGSVPEAIIAFLGSVCYEDAVRNAVSLGGDSDTQACIAGGIAEAFYREIPEEILREVKSRLTEELWAIVEEFYRVYKLQTPWSGM